jgi:hypothetical protein
MKSPRCVHRLLPFCCLTLAAFSFVGCSDSASSTFLSPNFVVEDWNTSHGVFTAKWYITIKNNGAPGSQLVQFWHGSSEDSASRNVLYSERHSLGIGEQKTLEISWTHGGIGVFASGAVYGFDEGIEFLP